LELRWKAPLVVGYEHFRLDRQGQLLSPKTLIYYDELLTAQAGPDQDPNHEVLGWHGRIAGGEDLAHLGDVKDRPVVRYATGSPQRVRAFMRVMRRAKASTCCGRVEAAGAAQRPPHGDRREPAGEWSDAGGPSPLTEDRQKPNRRQCGTQGVGLLRHSEGRRGTRNSVPSRAAFVTAKALIETYLA